MRVYVQVTCSPLRIDTNHFILKNCNLLLLAELRLVLMNIRIGYQTEFTILMESINTAFSGQIMEITYLCIAGNGYKSRIIDALYA